MLLVYDSLGFMLNRASWTMANRLGKNFKKQGIDLTLAQYTIMRVLFEKDGCCQLDIAKSLYKDTATIKRNLDILEKKRLVERRPASLCKYNIHLTPKGQGLKGKIMEVVEQTSRELLEDIPEQTIEAAVDFLKKIYVEPKNKTSK